MTPLRATFILFFCLAFVGTASARTPTPTATPVPTTAPTATASPSQSAEFAGSVWVDARIVIDRGVTAMIGNTVCATVPPPYITPPGGGGPVFSISVPSEEVLPGCGYEGTVVTFLVGDLRAPQTAVWHAGAFQGLELTIGPRFANFITITGAEVEKALRAGGKLVPYVGGKACGYGGVVYSNEQAPGCGVEGSQITFKLLDAEGNVVAVANQTAAWYAWDGNYDHAPRLNLTFTPAGGIKMPGTGTGDVSPGEASVWGWLTLLLALVGLASAAGLALRRRAMTR